MRFIDQSKFYLQKSVSLQQAIISGRARLIADDGAENLSRCFFLDLAVTDKFDEDIGRKLNFNHMTAGEKLDLFIRELLPNFFQADRFHLTGRDHWIVKVTIDGSHSRTLFITEQGVETVNGGDLRPHVELETDMITLLAMLRSGIQAQQLSPYDVVNFGPFELGDEQASLIYAGGGDGCGGDSCAGDKDCGTDGQCGSEGCGSAGCGGFSCGSDGCGAAGCGGQACGSDLCAGDACGAAGCTADGCVAAGCGTEACGGDVCGGDGCVADTCGAEACGVDACGAEACSVDVCGVDSCAAKQCPGAFDVCTTDLQVAKDDGRPGPDPHKRPGFGSA